MFRESKYWGVASVHVQATRETPPVSALFYHDVMNAQNSGAPPRKKSTRSKQRIETAPSTAENLGHSACWRESSAGYLIPVRNRRLRSPRAGGCRPHSQKHDEATLVFELLAARGPFAEYADKLMLYGHFTRTNIHRSVSMVRRQKISVFPHPSAPRAGEETALSPLYSCRYGLFSLLRFGFRMR